MADSFQGLRPIRCVSQKAESTLASLEQAVRERDGAWYAERQANGWEDEQDEPIRAVLSSLLPNTGISRTFAPRKRDVVATFAAQTALATLGIPLPRVCFEE